MSKLSSSYERGHPGQRGTGRVVATMSGPWPGSVDVVRPTDLYAWTFLWRMCRNSKGAEVVIIRGTSGLHERYVELLFAMFIKLRWRHPPRLIIGDATWDITSRRLEVRFPAAAKLLPLVARMGIRAVDGPHVSYAVLSTEELDAFPLRWGIDERRVYFAPFCATMSPSRAAEATDGGYIFAGGNSYRDYELLVDAVEGLEVPVRIASSWKPSRELKPGVSVRLLTPEQYDRELLGAKLVVVPVRAAARSAGQQTYLNAMMLGKLVIVTDAPGVHNYVSDGETGLVVASDPGSLRHAIDWALDPSNARGVNEMAARARATVVEHFLREHYFSRLWDLALQHQRLDHGTPGLE